MAWLRRKAEVDEVIVLDPGGTVSGPCAFCLSMEGRSASEVGYPPFHNHCACKTEMRQTETQPGSVLDENFGMFPEMPNEDRDPGGVEVLSE